jgi:hypothetical protein
VTGGCEMFEVRGPNPDKLARWKRCYGRGPDGTVFIPSSITDYDEQLVTMTAAYDGIPVVRHLGHAYFPAKWIATQYREAASVARVIEKIAHEHREAAA